MIETANKLFITRKRKKWKFAHFNEWPNCFNRDEVRPEFWGSYFGNSRPLVLEVGAGTADLGLALAKADTHKNIVALDVKSDRLYTGAKAAQSLAIKNIAFLRCNLNDIAEVFAPQSVEELWITFPDPFPRKSQAKHRLTHARFLDMYSKLLIPQGIVRFKTDNRELFLWSLEQIVASSWQLQELSFDLHESELSDTYKITTAYERRFINQGIAINYCSFRRKS